MREEYSDWLVAQGYNENTCNTQKSHIRQIENYYGDLADRIERGDLTSLVAEFTYTLADERANRDNPTKVAFSGRNYTRLQSLKGAIRRYAQFLSGDEDHAYGMGLEPLDGVEDAADIRLSQEKQRFALERDMQVALRENIAVLDPGLTIVDDGSERAVASGFIDILCQDGRDGQGGLVVVELKAGRTDARVVGQILGYMGDLIAEGDGQDVRGVIVAHEFDNRTISAARAIPNLTLVRYRIRFSFEALS